MARTKTAVPPRNCDLRDAAAEAGDVLGLLNAIAGTPPTQLQAAEEFGRLQRLIQERSAADPVSFARGIRQHALGVISQLLLRTSYFLQYRLTRHDKAFRYKPPVDLGPELSQVVLPRFLQLTEQLLALENLAASTDRIRALTDVSRLKAEQLKTPQPSRKAAKKPKSATKGPRRQAKQSRGHGEPLIHNRLLGLLN